MIEEGTQRMDQRIVECIAECIILINRRNQVEK